MATRTKTKAEAAKPVEKWPVSCHQVRLCCVMHSEAHAMMTLLTHFAHYDCDGYGGIARDLLARMKA